MRPDIQVHWRSWAISNLRATGSIVRGTSGHSNVLVPVLRTFNEKARYVDQVGGKRKGSMAMYLEPWHADVLDVLELRKNHGKEEQRARDPFSSTPFGRLVSSCAM